MTKQVFYDPQRKRWKRLRRIFDVLALLGLVVGAIFVIGLIRMRPLPELLLQNPKRNFRTASTPVGPAAQAARSCTGRLIAAPTWHPRTSRLNQGEGLRAAYYVEDDPASYSSLKEHITPDRPALSRSGCTWSRPMASLSSFTHRQSPLPVDRSLRRAPRRRGEQGSAHVIAKARRHRNLSAGEQL